MKSEITRVLSLKYEPIVIFGTNEEPKNAVQFGEDKMGCVIDMLIAAVRGMTAVFSRRTCGCPGGGTGLGFGNQYKNLPGGEEAFCYFLSVGAKEWERGRIIAKLIRPFVNHELHHTFINGERYIKSPDLVKRFLDCLPMMNVPFEYIVFKPFSQINLDHVLPKTVIFLLDYDQLSAMVCMANYDRECNNNVITPFAAGCQSIGIYPFYQSTLERPKAVIGLVDLNSRVKLKRQLKDDVLSFAVPYTMFQEMEANIAGSFLEGSTWRELISLKTGVV